MNSLKRTFAFLFATAILALSATSCSKASVADEDALYETHQGVDKNKIVVPTNG
ncbi:hypothetical protein [Robertkochia sediminum]|uniref:hypothetical protein n=1 Tax=Robertkochia sediminum TaxID=2785326 RepID=UPI0019317908|nr:hypothetical protein [Robertkochia sediminum]MBL7471191.1 hypothetical protein [Robertkochia sediminum]